MGKVKLRRLKMLRIIGIFFLLSLVLASLPIPHSPFTIPEVQAAVSYSYNDDTRTVTCSGTGSTTLAALRTQDRAAVKSHALTWVWTSLDLPLVPDYAVRPLDDLALRLKVEVTNFVSGATMTLTGTDWKGSALTENIVITANGIYQTTNYFRTLTQISDDALGDYSFQVWQDRWGIIGSNPVPPPDTNIYTIQGGIIIESGVTLLHNVAWALYIRSPNDGTSAPDYNFRVNAGGTITFGQLISIPLKLGKTGPLINQAGGAGSTFVYQTFFNNGGTLNWYGVRVANSVIRSASGSTTRIWCSSTGATQFIGEGYDIYNVQVSSAAYFTDCVTYPFSGTVDLVTAVGITSSIIRMHSNLASDVTINNLWSRTHLKVVTINLISSAFNKNVYFINPDFDTWSFVFYSMWAGKVYRQYTFDLTTTANSTIEITYYGQGGGTIYNATDLDGIIPTQTISKGFYNYTGGDTLYSFEPFHLKISESGYQTYEANFTLTKTSWEIGLIEDENLPPVARFTFSPSNPQPSQTVFFNASASSDPDGYITNYYWTFGDGYSYNSSSPTTTHSYAAASSYNVTLEVTDSQGLKNTFSQIIIAAATDTSTTPSPSIDIYPDYDIQILPLPDYLIHVPFFGESFQATLYLHNKGKFGKETQVTFWIEDENQQKIYEKSESLYVNKLETRDLAVSLTRPAATGTYTLYAQITSQTRTKTVAQQSFQIYNVLGWLAGPGIIVSVILIILVACAAWLLLKRFVWY